jgi:hypothetical protein
MKKLLFIHVIIICVIFSCRNASVKEGDRSATQQLQSGDSLILIGKDIITEVIVRPDTLGDPWEVEKVEGYNGLAMYNAIFSNAYNGRIPVFNILTEQPMKPDELKKMEREFVSDYSMIGKLQFIEDWYFDPAINKLTKIVKSVSFGYESPREETLPTSYRAMFMVIPEQ